ncbi:MAG TPA: hypothetical protein VJV75_10775, partial [Candidatus Polarisedimenticolia bacterium]|nr:hypothetical protein [Candidatus Polarisedimenticolia bacterium]
MRVLRPALIALAIACSTPSALPARRAATRALTFADRVNAEEAIARIYYRYQIGATQTFEEALPRAALEARVHDTLRKSVLVEKDLQTAITPKMLDAEIDRMIVSSMLPDRLAEIFAALKNDRELIRECVARPILVDRKAREYFAYFVWNRQRAKADAVDWLTASSVDWDAWWEKRAMQVDESKFAPFADDRPKSERPPKIVMLAAAGSCRPADTWGRIEGERQPPLYMHFTTVWTGSLMIAWGEVRSDTETGVGGRYDPATNSWSPVSARNAPSQRWGHVAVWTGGRMLVWGGQGGGSYPNTGGRYDPLLDAWAPMSVVDAPSGRYYTAAVWTGKEMLVWGGSNTGLNSELNSGGRYDPTADRWTPISFLQAPTPRVHHVAVWTGTRMIVWGGFGFSPSSGLEPGNLGSGSAYDPQTDTWSRI